MFVQCGSTRLGGARCSLPAGHDGSHLQIEDNGTTGWENTSTRWSVPKGENHG